MADDPRIKIITGHFGSGKTEISLNLSLMEKKKYTKVAISDLDVINPYFRSREARISLEQSGIELIAPKGKIATADLPYVTGELNGAIHDNSRRLIIDVGGDKDGATALGQYYNDLKNKDYEMYFVINANRPYVSTVEGIADTIKQIEKISRLKISGLINNTNLGIETTLADIEKGYELSLKAADKLDLPLLYTTIVKSFMKETEQFTKDHQVIYIERFMKLPWE